VQDGSGSARGRWGTAIALSVAVVFLPVFDAVPLVALPLAVLLMALPTQDRWRWIAAGTLVWIVAVMLPGGTLGTVARGWSLLLASAFLFVTLVRPGWGVFPRSMAALGVTFAAGIGYLLVSSTLVEVDWLIRDHFQTVSTVAGANLQERAPESRWVQELSTASDRMATLQWRLFPAVLGLQSLAALALASWWVARLRNAADTPLGLRPLREFRFSDQLVWVLVAGLVLVLFSASETATRTGQNVLLFMGTLYALRGVGVFIFLVGRAPSWFTMVFGALAAIFLYPLVLTAAVLVGLGDTWLDVRGRAAVAAPRPDA
jgi:hypothetical protein